MVDVLQKLWKCIYNSRKLLLLLYSDFIILEQINYYEIYDAYYLNSRLFPFEIIIYKKL